MAAALLVIFLGTLWRVKRFHPRGARVKNTAGKSNASTHALSLYGSPSPHPVPRGHPGTNDSLLHRRVRLVGLSNAADLNGRFGVVVSIADATNDR